MKKITKKEIKKYVREAISNNFNWEIDKCGFYIKNDSIKFFISYKGQGADENIYNNTYEEIIYIDDIIEDYKRKEYNLKDVDSIVHENVNNMIIDYNEEIEENERCIKSFIKELKSSVGEEFTVLEYDNFVQEKYNYLVNKTDSWDFFMEGEVYNYLDCGSYPYSGLGKDYDIDLNIVFDVIKINIEKDYESIIKIKDIELL
ncbi:hypothetical protein KWL52_006805 [Clostridioides difficile]|nr:hypothetical protein [Clostridioides difficile]MBZ1159247.1 hypothetical protein [Clostridioides difficile]MCO5822849.1 hypothetical protein [Clostridioides difficile]MCZ1068621.1 hypothetical protein [Clostridioides difficile]MDC2934673.1 hypothetical protein [Clostridioides difficile]